MSETQQTERITFTCDKTFLKALQQYSSDRNISMSNFIKELVGSKLIKENYLKKGGS